MAEDNQDFYQILGVDRSATQEDISAAYKAMMKESHPDKYMNAPEGIKKAALEESQRISEAYDTLGDPDKRAAYDAFIDPLSQEPQFDEDTSSFVIAELKARDLDVLFKDYSSLNEAELTAVRDIFKKHKVSKALTDISIVQKLIRDNNLFDDVGKQIRLSDVFDHEKVKLIMNSRGIPLPADFGQPDFPFYPKDKKRFVRPGQEFPDNYGIVSSEQKPRKKKNDDDLEKSTGKRATSLVLKALGLVGVVTAGLSFGVGLPFFAVAAASSTFLMTYGGFNILRMYGVTSIPYLATAHIPFLSGLLNPDKDVTIFKTKLPFKKSLAFIAKVGIAGSLTALAYTSAPILALAAGAATLVGSASLAKLMQAYSEGGSIGNPETKRRMQRLENLRDNHNLILNSLLTIDPSTWFNNGYGKTIASKRIFPFRQLETLGFIRTAYHDGQRLPGFEDKQIFKYAMTIGEFMHLHPYDRKLAFEAVVQGVYGKADSPAQQFDLRYVPFWERLTIRASDKYFDVAGIQGVINGYEIDDLVLGVLGKPAEKLAVMMKSFSDQQEYSPHSKRQSIFSWLKKSAAMSLVPFAALLGIASAPLTAWNGWGSGRTADAQSETMAASGGARSTTSSDPSNAATNAARQAQERAQAQQQAAARANEQKMNNLRDYFDSNPTFRESFAYKALQANPDTLMIALRPTDNAAKCQLVAISAAADKVIADRVSPDRVESAFMSALSDFNERSCKVFAAGDLSGGFMQQARPDGETNLGAAVRVTVGALKARAGGASAAPVAPAAR